MHNSFLSIVGAVQNAADASRLRVWLENVFAEIESNFADFEIVLVNNIGQNRAFDEAISGLPEALRKHVFLLNLATPVHRNHAILAGLDRANGDWTALFELDFAEKAHFLTQLFEKSQADGGSDVVYLRAASRDVPTGQSPFYGLFYWILRRYGHLEVDSRARTSRIISRRALNSLLRLRENMRFMKAIYPMVGFRTGFVETSESLGAESDGGFHEKLRTSMLAITSYTTFLRTLMGWIFVLAVGVSSVAIFNAIKVKFTNIDIFGEHHETLSGWAFLVVLISIFFSITCLNLYILGIYLSNIYQEMKNRPPYIIESVRRF